VTLLYGVSPASAVLEASGGVSQRDGKRVLDSPISASSSLRHGRALPLNLQATQRGDFLQGLLSLLGDPLLGG
jgi:hypothetical protein